MLHLQTYEDYQNIGYKIITFEDTACVTMSKNYYTDLNRAKLKAESIHLENITKISISEFEVNEDREAIRHWCDRYQISKEICAFQIDKQIKQGWDKWKHLYDLP